MIQLIEINNIWFIVQLYIKLVAATIKPIV